MALTKYSRVLLHCSVTDSLSMSTATVPVCHTGGGSALEDTDRRGSGTADGMRREKRKRRRKRANLGAMGAKGAGGSGGGSRGRLSR